jgi:integrase
VPTLAENLIFDPPSTLWLTEVGQYSNTLKNFLWNGLSGDIRKVYTSAQKSYELFTASVGVSPYPTTPILLGEWVSLRALGSTYESKLSPDAILSYLSAIQSAYIDRQLPTTAFESKWLQRIIAGIRRTAPNRQKNQALPITPDILSKITLPYNSRKDVNSLNINAAFKLAFAAFLRSGEFTYDDRLDSRTFVNTTLTRSDVTFSDSYDHLVLRLKRSKTDTKHLGVDIIVAATGTRTCPIAALRDLFELDPQPPVAPLFRLQNSAFTYSRVVPILQDRARLAGVPHPTSYRGHSFRRGAAQHASNLGLPESDIQALGRWSSQAFKIYFKTIHTQRYKLSSRFLTGTLPSIT